MKIKRFFKTEIAKLQAMTFTEKRQYIWEYYKLHLFALAFLAILLGWFINHTFINPPKQDYLYIAWVGDEVLPDTLGEIAQHLNVIVNDPDRQRVMVWSYAHTGNPQLDHAIQQRFAAMFHTGGIDALFAPYSDVEAFSSAAFSRGMGEVMTYVAAINPALYAQVSSQLLSLTFTRDTGEGPEEITDYMAVSLAGTPFFDYLNFDAADVYLMPVVTTNNFEAIAKALEAIFQWNP